MSLPHYIVLGAAKCGTSSLSRALRAHPDVFMTTPKEVDFFNRHYQKGMDWYESLYAEAGSKRVLGEGSVLYSIGCLWPEVPERIAQHAPGVKFLYMVRHPIDRIESMWCQHVHNGDLVPGFAAAVREWRPLIDASLYLEQLKRYRRHFPDEQFKVFFLKDFKENSPEILRQTLDFLGVEAGEAWLKQEWKANTRAVKKTDRAIWAAVRNTWAGRQLRARVDEDTKDTFRGFLRKPLDVTPIWDEATLDWAVREVKDDALRFLEWMGRPADHWDFSDAWRTKKLEQGKKSGQGSHGAQRAFVLAGLDYWEEG